MSPLATMPIIVVCLLYMWFISAGTWSSWPPTAIYDYYSKLAAAFQRGQLFLADKPSAELLALPDPYRIGARKNIPYIWDASLFRGRYYLYWGPAPALLLVPIKLVFPTSEIGDIHLVFAFVTLLYCALCLLVFKIWNRFFAGLPPWTLGLGLVLAGLAPPLTWMLNRPEVYEAAIAGGQFFLFAGFYWLYAGFDSEKPAVWKFALASLFWGLAIGCRTSQALPVILLVVAAALRLSTRRRRPEAPARPGAMLVAILVPLALSIAALAWYNWARFGSIFESGYRYQLTLLQLPKHYNEIFSPDYVRPNLANYLLNPFTTIGRFPFIKPQYGSKDLGTLVALPRIYFAEALTGLMYTFPFMVLAVVGFLPIFRGWPPGGSRRDEAGVSQVSLGWLQGMLAGVLALEFFTLLVFFFATERYLADAVPALTLLSLVGFWQGCKLLERSTRWRPLFNGLAILLAALTIGTSSLLAVSSYQERFAAKNPALMERIDNLLGR
jgi:hypothetical protein